MKLNSKKVLKYALVAGAAYVAFGALKKSGALSGLGLGDDDLSMSLPGDVNVPVMQYPYGYNPQYQYGYPQQQPYAGGYPYGSYNPYSRYSPFGAGLPNFYPQVPPLPPTPPASGFYFNPFGGQSVGGAFIPKIITPSGGIGRF